MSREDAEPGVTAFPGPVIVSPPDWAVSPDGHVTIAGTSRPSSRIIIRDWLAAVAECVADDGGHWQTTLTHLRDGAHVLVAEWVDQDGHLVAGSSTRTVLVQSETDRAGEDAGQNAGETHGIRSLLHRRQDTAGAPDSTPADRPILSSAWSVPAIDAEPEEPEASAAGEDAEGARPAVPPLPGAPQIMRPPAGSQVGRMLTLYGTAAANRGVDVLDGMVPIAATKSDDTGYWTVTLKGLTPGPHLLHARSFAERDAAPLISLPIPIVVSERPRQAPGPAAAGL
jgi:hypothetical protein